MSVANIQCVSCSTVFESLVSADTPHVVCVGCKQVLQLQPPATPAPLAFSPHHSYPSGMLAFFNPFAQAPPAPVDADYMRVLQLQSLQAQHSALMQQFQSMPMLGSAASPEHTAVPLAPPTPQPFLLPPTPLTDPTYAYPAAQHLAHSSRRPCRCGSFTHQRTNHKLCPLNFVAAHVLPSKHPEPRLQMPTAIARTVQITKTAIPLYADPRAVAMWVGHALDHKDLYSDEALLLEEPRGENKSDQSNDTTFVDDLEFNDSISNVIVNH